MFKKIFLSFFFLTLVFLPKTASAAADLGISIDSLESAGNDANLTLTLQNNSFEFVSAPEYTVQFYKGDKLQESGYLFKGLEFVKSVSGTFDNVAPESFLVKDLKIDLPSSIESGNYFLRVTVADNAKSHFGATFSETPLFLTGTGGFVGGVNAYMRTPRGLTGLMEGDILNKGEVASLEIPLAENPKLAKYIKDKKVNLRVQITSVNNPALTSSEEIALPSSEKNKIILPFAKSFYEKSGAYTVVVNFLDQDKKETIAEDLYARILVGGTSARIENIETDTNFFKKNSSLDLKVSVVVGGHTSVDPLKVVAKFKDGEKTFIQKEVSVVPTHTTGESESLMADFSNLSSEKKILVTDIEVQVFDVSGNLLASEVHKNNIDKKIVDGVPVVNLLPIIISLIVILIGVIVLFVVRRKKDFGTPSTPGKSSTSTIVTAFAILLIGSAVASLVYVTQNLPQAYATHPVPVYAKVFTSTTGGLTLPEGNFGSCAVEKNVDVFLEVSCAHCLNINDGYLKYFKDYTTQTWTSLADVSVVADINGNLSVNGVNQGNAISNDIYGHPIHGAGSGSHLWGPFRLKVGVDKSKLTAPGVFTQNYRIQTQVTPGGFCKFATGQTHTKSFSCTYIQNPTGLTAKPSTSCGAKVDLSWSVVPTGAGYKVYRSTSSTGGFVEVANVTTTTYTDTAPTPSTKYYYKVTAYSASGIESDLSTATSVESDSSVACTCADGSPMPSSGICPTVTSTFCPDGVTPIPADGICRCPDGSVMPADGKCPITPPSKTTISSISTSCDGTTGTKNTLRFSATSSVYPVTYKIERKAKSAATFTEVGTYTQASSADSSPAYTDSPLSFNSDYDYRVSASNSAGTGPVSSISSVSTKTKSECDLEGDGGGPKCDAEKVYDGSKCCSVKVAADGTCPDDDTTTTTTKHRFCKDKLGKCPDPKGKALKLNGLLTDPTVVKSGETCTVYLRGEDDDKAFSYGFNAFDGLGGVDARCTLSGPGVSVVGFNPTELFTVLKPTGAIKYPSGPITGTSIYTLKCSGAGVVETSVSATCRVAPREVEVSFLEKVLKTSSRLKDGLLGAVLFSIGAK